MITFQRAGDLLLTSQPDGAGIAPQEMTEEEWALEIAYELDQHYPGHPWQVSFQGGAVVLRHAQIADAVAFKTGKQGFGSLLPPHRAGSRKEVLKAAVQHGGELLEAFQMPRGAWRAEFPPICPDWNWGKTRDFT